MADLMRDHIGLRELAGLAADIAAAEAGRDLAEERSVEIDLLVARAVERPHRALRDPAACRLGGAAVHDQCGRPIGRVLLGEDVLPLRLGGAEHARDEAPHFVLRRAGLPRPRRLVHARPFAIDHFRAADEE